jgi:hypothetical protein
VRYEAAARRRGRRALLEVGPAPLRAVDDRPQAEYLGEPFVVARAQVSSCVVRAEVRLVGRAEAGVIARWSYDQAYALLVTPEEALLCRYGVTQRRVLDRSPLPGAGWLELELRAIAGSLRGQVAGGGVRLSAVDPRPLAAGAFGLVVNASDPERAARAEFRSFAAASPEAPKAPRPRIAYRFTGAVVPSERGDYRARVAARTMLGEPVSFELSQDRRFSRPRRVGPVSPEGRLRAARAWLDGLEPGRSYYWRPLVAAADGDVYGRPVEFRTPPEHGGGVRFAFASCTSGRVASYPSFATASSFRPHFYLHAGDWGYAGQNSLDHRPDHFQARWTRLLREPNVASLLDATPLLLWQDDHDYAADNGWSETVPPWAAHAWDELVANPGRRYFDIRWGDVHVFCLDCRFYASDPAAPDDERKSRLGRAQRSWLETGLRSTDAAVVVIASPMAFRNKVAEDPGWHNVYTHERDELLRLFSSLDATPLILSGDSHGHRLIHHFEFGELYEVTASGTDFPASIGWGQGNNDPQHTLVNITDRTGFALVDLDPAGPARRVTVRSIAARGGKTMFRKSLPVAG